MTKSSEKNSFVSDTMGIVLFIEGRRLPSKIEKIYGDTLQNKKKIYLPAIVLAEILYLSERKRIKISFEELKIFLDKNVNFIEYTLNFDVLILLHT